jgi:hypothetical protein
MVVTFAGADVTIGGARGPMHVPRQKKASLPDFYHFHQCLASGTIFSQRVQAQLWLWRLIDNAPRQSESIGGRNSNLLA